MRFPEMHTNHPGKGDKHGQREGHRNDDAPFEQHARVFIHCKHSHVDIGSGNKAASPKVFFDEAATCRLRQRVTRMTSPKEEHY